MRWFAALRCSVVLWLQNDSDVHSTEQERCDDLGQYSVPGEYVGDLLYDSDIFVAVERIKQFRDFFNGVRILGHRGLDGRSGSWIGFA